MSEKPILFNTEMVLAILDGRKTQTRRVVKAGNHTVLRGGTFPGALDGQKYGAELDNHGVIVAPYQKGDILYVREAWIENNNPHSDNCGGYEYRADYDGALCQSLIKWRPSIHMPKKAARIFLRVTDVKVQRLKSISTSDAFDEGFRDWNDLVRVWDGTIKPEDREKYGWFANPWVWAITFERVSKEATK